MVNYHELPIDRGIVARMPAIAEGFIKTDINCLDMILIVDLGEKGRVE